LPATSTTTAVVPTVAGTSTPCLPSTRCGDVAWKSRRRRRTYQPITNTTARPYRGRGSAGAPPVSAVMVRLDTWLEKASVVASVSPDPGLCTITSSVPEAESAVMLTIAAPIREDATPLRLSRITLRPVPSRMMPSVVRES
jgi:hypothetical protein